MSLVFQSKAGALPAHVCIPYRFPLPAPKNHESQVNLNRKQKNHQVSCNQLQLVNLNCRHSFTQFEQNACDPSAELEEGGKHIKIKVWEKSQQRLYLSKSTQIFVSIMIC